MFWYSVPLTLIVLAILTVIVISSLLIEPLFQRRLNEQLPLLYEGFDLKLPQGKLIALMGSSGAGRSTLTKLLLAFYQPHERIHPHRLHSVR